MSVASPLGPGERRAAARVFADAFVDDPGWRDSGPAHRGRRHAFVRRVCGGELWAAPRTGGTVLVTHDEGKPSAAVVWFAPGAGGSPLLTAAQAPGPLLAGPAVVRRGLAAQDVMSSGHPAEPHLHVSLLAVSPQHQRGGRGRALLEAAIAEADRLGVPAYLDTANPANLPYYHGFGFRTTGEARLPRGAPMWFLLRAR